MLNSKLFTTLAAVLMTVLVSVTFNQTSLNNSITDTSASPARTVKAPLYYQQLGHHKHKEIDSSYAQD